MRERPILMSAPMVRALLNGTKTQTRRVAMHTVCGLRVARLAYDPAPDVRACPYGAPGDLLWVRESGLESLRAKLFIHDATPGRWWTPEDGGRYGASYGPAITRETLLRSHRARPSIHMPRWASRLTLRITDVRVERVQDISEADARAEGCPFDHEGNQYEPPAADPWQGYGRASFSLLWSKINGGASWDANPWVWVVAFERVEVAHG